MGLDMYLYASKYESLHTYNIADNEELSKKVKRFYGKDLYEVGMNNARHNFLSKETKYQIGYWRKFNALHHYFEERYEADDLLRGVYLGKSEIEDIIDILVKVKLDLNTCNKSKKQIKVGWHKDENGKMVETKETIEVYDSKVAMELLPPGEGFFYGSQELDEWYKQDIEYSIELFVKALELKNKDYDIYYDASW